MTRHLKIAMVAACPFPYGRGTPIRIFRMGEALSQRGHDVHVVAYHLGDRANGVPFKIHRTPKVISYRRYAPGPTYQKLLVLDPLLFIKLFKVLKTHDIDLVHAHHYEGLLVSLLVRRWTKHPIVYDAHALLEAELPVYSLVLPKQLKMAIGRGFDRRFPKLANHTITVTEEIKTQLLKHGGITPRDITVITNGVESENFQVKSNNHSILTNRAKMLVYAGSLAPYQRIDLLLRAFSEVLKERRDVRLLIVSPFPFDDYEPLANKLGIRGNIDFIQSGFDGLPVYLAGADIALNSRTVSGGIPQKLLNYMAAGKPIVSFEGSAEILEHGETGWVVENANIAAFSQGVLRLIQDAALAARLGANARKHVTSEYTWEKTAEKAERVYEQVLSAVKPNGRRTLPR